MNCRAPIVSRYVESTKSSGMRLYLPKHKSLIDMALYDLVFVQINKYTKIDLNFMQENTMYGLGYDVTRLNEASLNNCKPDEDGLIRVLVGVAFRFNAAEFGPAFCSSLNNKGK